MGREKETPPNPWEVAAELSALHKTGGCLFPRSELDSPCQSKAIGSHTVPKSMLRRIAQEGHVYQCDKAFQDRLRNKDDSIWQLIGTNRASATPIFCAQHDSELFAPLEQQNFSGTPQQCFLLAYRAFCYELFAKQAFAAAIPILRRLDKGKPIQAQLAAQWDLDAYETGIRAALADAKYEKEAFDAALISKDWSQVRAFILFFGNAPEVLSSAAICPEFDFSGRELQSLEDLSVTLDVLTFSLITAGAGGAFVFSWLCRSDATSRLVAQSLNLLNDVQISHAVFRFVFEFCENHYIKPQWWDSISRSTREAIEQRFKASLRDRESSCLRDDGLRAIDWQVAERRWL